MSRNVYMYIYIHIETTIKIIVYINPFDPQKYIVRYRFRYIINALKILIL